MKLSEAMRKGSKMGKQTFNGWVDGDGGGCALTLTAMGVGLLSKMAIEHKHGFAPIPYMLLAAFPELNRGTDIPCGCTAHGVTLWHMIMHVNDVHKWTAERIAGWIEAHVETPTYSALDIQHYMGDPEKAEVPHV